MSKNPIIFIFALFLCAASSSALAAYVVGKPWPSSVIPYKFAGGIDAISPTSLENFNYAVDYFHKNTKLRLVNVTDNPSYSSRSSYVLVKTDGPRAGGFATHGSLCIDCQLRLGDTSSIGTAIHEIFHLAGFGHEHQRQDHHRYIEVLDGLTDNYGKIDYPFWNEWSVGSYDYDSVVHYWQNLYWKISQSATLDLIKERSSEDLQLVLILEDDTPEDSFDNFALNNEGSSPTALPFYVSIYNNDWMSAQFDFDYTGMGNRFFIKHRRSSQYLSAGSSGLELSSTPGIREIWEFIPHGNGYRIKASWGTRYLVKSGGEAALNSAPNDDVWLIKIKNARSSYDSLSNMDIVGIHVAYGGNFRIREVDSTPLDITDNNAVHVQNGYLEVSPGSSYSSWSGNHLPDWWSARWIFEPVTECPFFCFRQNPTIYIRIKNLWTQEYLNVEGGILDASPYSEPLDDRDWQAAQWIFEIKKDHFLIQSRLTGEYLHNNAGALAIGEEKGQWLFDPVF